MASDHAGSDLKEKIRKDLMLKSGLSKFEIVDLGPENTDPVDYPDYADRVCRKLHGFRLVQMADQATSLPSEVGILVCGSGQGMAMRANKFPHIRAALCWTTELAKLAREHNDANVLCVGARVMDHELVVQIVETFLTTPFAGGRHLERVNKLMGKID